MSLIFEIIFWILSWPIAGILEAVAGLLWPGESAVVRRLQRSCLAMLICGIGVAVVAMALAYISPGWYVLALFGIAAVFLIIGGAIGKRIELICQHQRSEHQ